jgi:hypothetical protein
VARDTCCPLPVLRLLIGAHAGAEDHLSSVVRPLSSVSDIVKREHVRSKGWGGNAFRREALAFPMPPVRVERFLRGLKLTAEAPGRV